jgi:uncharacterized protein (DUF2267 family)
MRDGLNSRVALHLGIADEEAGPVIVAVLRALRRQLGHPEAEALADELPDELAAALRQGSFVAGSDLALAVATHERVPPARAVEHAAAVAHGLAELLPEELLARLRQALPAPTAALLEPPPPLDPDEVQPPPRASRRTLSEGRPGSSHPLSEARPFAAQANSVIASDNPHADTKLSSARGLTQERERESLADGEAGARRSLAHPERQR